MDQPWSCLVRPFRHRTVGCGASEQIILLLHANTLDSVGIWIGLLAHGLRLASRKPWLYRAHIPMM